MEFKDLQKRSSVMVESNLNQDLAQTHQGSFRRKKEKAKKAAFEVDEVKSGMWSVQKKIEKQHK